MGATSVERRRGDILVVDDTPENLGVVSNVLKEGGYRVRAVTSGALALEAARAKAPDLALFDINMPEMDGYELCRRFKDTPALADIPIIFLSALSDTPDKLKAFTSGGVDYVTKPFRMEEIAARIETHLAIRRLQLDLQNRNEELGRSYAKLEELERARQTLVEMIVHDLKNPIAAIQVCTEFVRDETISDDARLALEDILGVTRLMTRMVLDVLDVAKTEKGRLEPRLASLDLIGLLGEVEHDAQKRAHTMGKTLAVEVAPDVPRQVYADRDLLRRLLDNLLDNSFKYAPGNTQIRIEVTRAGEAVYLVAVRDRGRGVPESERQRIFETYARLDRHRDMSARTSRGLGLAFCRLAAEAHGGSIWVEDNVPQGSAFMIRLPEDPRRSTGPLAAAADAPSVKADGASMEGGP
jgi:two-component system, sensor histidine kinase and response regulator